MNKTAIKNYATWARVQLIESCKQRAFEYGVTKDGNYVSNLKTIGSRILTDQEFEQRNQLIGQIKQKGYAQVMEEAAYTWFNRFIALRFMEVNGYLPSKVRVFTDEIGAFKPEILKEAMTVDLEGIDRAVVIDLLERQDNESLYKYLLITQCNALSSGLPYMFETIANWTELLFPANILRSDSVIGRMITDIPEEDWLDEVEIIGWFYQYYISERHKLVIDSLHGKTIKKEDIPAATQIFTTDWVVRYIVDNSLGTYWMERNPQSTLSDKLTYYVKPVCECNNESLEGDPVKPDAIKVFDPCVGSGHFLSYAFDVLLEIYRECGWTDRDAAQSIIENNLYGLDIDDRAAQLACFAVTMKARKYNRQIINAKTQLHIMAIQEADLISDELIQFVSNYGENSEVRTLCSIFNNAKEVGSIIEIPKLDYESLYQRVNDIKNSTPTNLIEEALRFETIKQFVPLIQQAEILSGKYDIVVTNPPYMNRYSDSLKSFITNSFGAFKGDLFSVFMFRNFNFCKPNGYVGFMTPMVWLFIKSYESLRQLIIEHKTITTLIQFEYSAFEEATVPICSFVIKNKWISAKGIYYKLSDFRGGMNVQQRKILEAIENPKCGYCFESDARFFSKIPGKAIAYWLSPKGIDAFDIGKLSSVVETKQGFKTGNNDAFLRLWYEVSLPKLYLGERRDTKKWFPCNKGGDYRKWYGNKDYAVNWEHDGESIKNYKDEKGKQLSRPQNISYNFKKGLTWSTISSGPISFRFSDENMMFESKGSECFFKDNNVSLYPVMAYLNSKVCMYYLLALAPTIDYSEGSIIKLPWISSQLLDCETKYIEQKAIDCINMAKTDWDAFETSWDFKMHPLI